MFIIEIIELWCICLHFLYKNLKISCIFILFGKYVKKGYNFVCSIYCTIYTNIKFSFIYQRKSVVIKNYWSIKNFQKCKINDIKKKKSSTYVVAESVHLHPWRLQMNVDEWMQFHNLWTLLAKKLFNDLTEWMLQGKYHGMESTQLK